MAYRGGRFGLALKNDVSPSLPSEWLFVSALANRKGAIENRSYGCRG